MTVKSARAFMDRGFETDGSRTLPALDGGAPIYFPPPVGPPPPPPTSMLVGSSIEPQSSAAVNTLEGQLGQTLGVLRLYDSGFPSAWSGSVGNSPYVNGRPIILSMKPDIPSMGNGSLDAQFNNILDGAPTSEKIYWALGQHEPDVKINKGTYTLAQWQAAAKRMANLIKARSVANWKCIVIVTAQPWDTGHSYTQTDFWLPGYSDCMGIDKYNPVIPSPSNTNYHPLSYFIGKAVTWFKANSVPWGVTETGAYEDVTDFTKKSNWLIQAGDYAGSNSASYFTYWDNAFASDPDQTARRLASSASSLRAYASVMAKYNT